MFYPPLLISFRFKKTLSIYVSAIFLKMIIPEKQIVYSIPLPAL